MKYQDVVFAQGDDADEPLQILRSQGIEAAIEYLAQWDHGEGVFNDKPQAGSGDITYTSKDGYRLSYNHRLGYIGLEKIINDTSGT